MNRRWLKIAGVFAALGAAGFLVAGAGLVPIAASSGHWSVTAWFLHFTMRQSVQTYSIGVKVPDLSDSSMVLRGAGHYDSGCRPCHGAPDQEGSVVAGHMTPEPPHLPERIGQWEPKELFWIVKHGVKFTGMPAWPAQQRDDEVWAVVAFLNVLPRLSAREYARLARGEEQVPSIAGRSQARLKALDEPFADVLANCARCHGRDGTGRGEGAIPRLAGQRETYLYASLKAYAETDRYSGIMQPVAAGLSDAMQRRLARYFATEAEPRSSSRRSGNPDVVERGKYIAQKGIPEGGVPSCIPCHGPGKTERNPYYPDLAGQYAEYLVLQLQLFKQRKRGGTPYVNLMKTSVHRLPEEAMRHVAAYYASLDAMGRGGGQSAASRQ